jgi:hypothetical protein
MSAVDPQRSCVLTFRSIVAVHGLGGDSFQTWTESDSKELWLRTFLPEDIERIRVMTFGYNANLLRKKSKGEIYKFAESLLSALRSNRLGNAVSSMSLEVLTAG